MACKLFLCLTSLLFCYYFVLIFLHFHSNNSNFNSIISSADATYKILKWFTIFEAGNLSIRILSAYWDQRTKETVINLIAPPSPVPLECTIFGPHGIWTNVTKITNIVHKNGNMLRCVYPFATNTVLLLIELHFMKQAM